MIETIFVRLVDEPVPVWRPVQAEKLGESTYLISDQEYDREIEDWEFEPGEKVECVEKLFKDTQETKLVAIKKI